MSRPRDATSVATRIATRPALKSSSARTRWDWVRSPWMAAASHPVADELVGEPAGEVLGAHEHERLVEPLARPELAEHVALLLAVHADRDLADGLDRLVALRDLDVRRIVQQARGEPADLVRERGREQQVLPARPGAGR